VSRRTTSLAVVIALLALSTAGPCLACSLSIQVVPEKTSCCHHGGCEKPTKAPAPQGCTTPDLGAATIEQAWTQVAHAGASILAPVTIARSAPMAADESKRLPFFDEYSPPHLYLRNSVLNI
jgi:hypothetical protein